MENVPRGTIAALADDGDDFIAKLTIYQRALEKWNPKINLVSPNSLSQLWERHFFDSAQLLPYVPRGTIAALDIGSGGGFPALVLAAARPEIQWKLIESDQRKCVFLRTAAREMGLTINVITARIEDVEPKPADLITARALAELDQLLKWATPFTTEQTNLIFPKGKTWQTELTCALENWQMKVEEFPSITDAQSRILRLSQVKKR